MVHRDLETLVVLDIFPGHGATVGAISSSEDPFFYLMLIIQVQIIGIAGGIAVFVVVHNGQFSSRLPADRRGFVFADFIVISGIPSQLEGKQQPIFIIDKAAVDVIEGTVPFV